MASAAVCVELVGEPGIGKTTLLGWLREEAAASGAHALGGRGSEFEHDVPFGILVDALDGHLRAIDDRWSRGLDADVVDELRQIFPALEPTDEQPRARGLSSERFRAYRAVRAMLECLAATRPLVLVLDDVHWADSSSAELLGALLRRPPSARVLIALAYRPHQTPDRLTRELAAAASDGVLQRIELGPLSGDEAEALMTPGLSGHERAWLRRESGGNPY